MVLGTVKVTASLPPPLSAAVTVPLPEEVVESVMLKSPGMLGNTVSAGASSSIVPVPPVSAAVAWMLVSVYVAVAAIGVGFTVTTTPGLPLATIE